MTTQDYIRKIRPKNRKKLLGLWTAILNKNTPGWDSGKAFEFLILRAFELEGAIIRWPYDVTLFNENVEQIDGVVHFDDVNLSVITEFKDYKNNLNIEPIAKLRNQLLRRPSSTIGCIFSTKGFTQPALVLSQFCFPQTILLWEKDHIEYCLKYGKFKDGLIKKYRHAVEEAFTNFDVTI